MRVRLRTLVAGLFCCLVSASLVFSPLAHALMTSSIDPDSAERMQMDHHTHHGEVAMRVFETSLDSGGAPIHCNEFGEVGACMLLCSACLSALPQLVDALGGVPRHYYWLQHYAGVNLLVDTNPPLRPPRH